jgi:hypothetical protein
MSSDPDFNGSPPPLWSDPAISIPLRISLPDPQGNDASIQVRSQGQRTGKVERALKSPLVFIERLTSNVPKAAS